MYINNTWEWEEKRHATRALVMDVTRCRQMETSMTHEGY